MQDGRFVETLAAAGLARAAQRTHPHTRELFAASRGFRRRRAR